MNRREADKKAYRVFHKRPYLKDSKRPSGPESRRVAAEQLVSHRAVRPARESAEYAEWKQEEARLFSAAQYYQYTIGYVNRDAAPFPFVGVAGQGDSWEEAFQQAAERGYRDPRDLTAKEK